MKRSDIIITILAAGSLWGLFEIIDMPSGLLCAIGIFFLILARSILNLPGSSTMIGAVVCLFKTYSAHFMMCQTAGVMALAVSFDLLAILLWRPETMTMARTTLLVALANIVALPIFLFWVTVVSPISYWTDGGLDRIFMYVVSSVLPAILLGILSGNAARLLGARIPAWRVSGIPRNSARVMVPSVLLAWTIASVVKFL